MDFEFAHLGILGHNTGSNISYKPTRRRVYMHTYIAYDLSLNILWWYQTVDFPT